MSWASRITFDVLEFRIRVAVAEFWLKKKSSILTQ